MQRLDFYQKLLILVPVSIDFQLNDPSFPLTELFPTGKNQESFVMRLDESRFVVGRDNISLFIGTDGKPTQKYAVTWSEVPSQIGRYQFSHVQQNPELNTK